MSRTITLSRHAITDSFLLCVPYLFIYSFHININFVKRVLISVYLFCRQTEVMSRIQVHRVETVEACLHEVCMRAVVLSFYV